VKSIYAEAPAWIRLIENGATEYVGWDLAEYRYLREDRAGLLLQARECLLEGKPSLEESFKPEEDIRSIR